MMWHPASPDLILIENLWAIVKKKIFAGVKQYENKAGVIQTVCKDVNSKEIERLTNSLEKQVVLVFERTGGHIGM